MQGLTLRRRIAFLVAAIGLALAAAAAYLGSADLGRHKDRLTPLISNALGRDLRIDGELSLHLGRTVTLRAADVSIANAAWASEPYLVQAAGIEAEIDFWSLVRGPILIESLALQGAVIRLQEADDGRRNWARPSTEAAQEDNATHARGALPRIAVFKARDVRILLSAPDLTGVSEVVVENADYAIDGDVVTANAGGEINGYPLALASTIVPAENTPTAGALRIDADVRMGDVILKAGIRLSDADTLAVSSAQLELSGPDIDYVFRVLKLPKITSGPLAIKANLTPDPQRSDFDAEGRLGEYYFAAHGWLEDIRGAGGFDVAMRLNGPSLAALGRPFNIGALPDLPFDIETGLRSRADGVELGDTRVIVGEESARAQGTIVWLTDGRQKLDVFAAYRGMSSTLVVKIPASWPAGELYFDFGVESEDAVDPARFLGLDHLVGQPFVLSANGTFGDRTVSLQEASVGVGEQTLKLAGRAGFFADAPDIELRFDAESIDLSPWLAGSDVLDARLGTVAGTGRLRVSQGKLDADELVLRSGDVELGGRVSLPLVDRGKTGGFALHLTAPSVDRLFPGLALDALDGQPVVLSANGSFGGRAVSLREAGVGLGEQRLELTGRAELVDDAPDIDFRFDAVSIDLSPWLAGSDVLDGGPGTVAGTGRLRVSQGRLDADELLLRSGDVELGGRVSLPLADRGKTGGFALHLTAPAVENLVPGLAGKAMGGQPVDLRADGSWTPGAWQLDELLWHIPERGDVRGSLFFAGSEMRTVQVRLSSKSLDLRPARKAAPASPNGADDGRVIPAREIGIPRFDDLDVDLQVEIDSLHSPVTAGASLVLEARLADNQLTVDRLETKGKRGQISASVTVEADPAAALEARLELHGRELYIAAPDEPAATLSARPRYDLKTNLQAKGANLRELAQTLSGRLLIQAEEGTITRRGGLLVTLVVDDFLTRTLETINPLIKERDEVQLNCFVVLAEIQNGEVQGAPLLALQTAEVNLLTRGEIDLGTESLKLDIVTRPRRGFGISLGDIINPFTRVGGTLAAPRLVADPGSAVFETGANILTGGGWVVARKFRDRFFAGNPCAKALERSNKANQQ
jgi:uncharacterized protein involved in outer membrane biogenesis